MSDTKKEACEQLLYSSSDMAKLCGISRRAWLEWVKKGWAPGGVLVGNNYKWLAADIERWIEKLRKDTVEDMFRDI